MQKHILFALIALSVAAPLHAQETEEPVFYRSGQEVQVKPQARPSEPETEPVTEEPTTTETIPESEPVVEETTEIPVVEEPLVEPTTMVEEQPEDTDVTDPAVQTNVLSLLSWPTIILALAALVIGGGFAYFSFRGSSFGRTIGTTSVATEAPPPPLEENTHKLEQALEEMKTQQR